MPTQPSFIEELTELINKHSMENDSNTPDFLLAKYLVNCLENYNQIVDSKRIFEQLNK